LPHVPQHPMVHHQLGFLYRELGAQETARRNPTKAEAWLKLAAEHHLAAADAVDTFDLPPATRARILDAAGALFLNDLKQIDRATPLFRRAIEADEGYVDAIEDLGLALARKKQWAEAVTCFERVLAKMPDRKASADGLKQALAGRDSAGR